MKVIEWHIMRKKIIDQDRILYIRIRHITVVLREKHTSLELLLLLKYESDKTLGWK